MRKFILLAIFILFCIYNQAQNNNNSFNSAFTDNSLGIVEYKKQIYKNCHASMYEWNDSTILISISPNNKKKDTYGNSTFDLYFTINKKDYLQPHGSFYYTRDAQLPDNFSGLGWTFKDWDIAEHNYSSILTNLYFQNWTENYYTISGNMKLENIDSDSVRFIYHGPIDEVKPEVLSIRAFAFNDPKENNGNIILNDTIIEIPFAYLNKENNKIKIYFMDRLIYQDKNLEYATSFLFNDFSLSTDKDQTYKWDSTNNSVIPAFFNQDHTETPEEATLIIKKPNKKGIYKLEYSMKFTDGKIIKGNYKGKLTF